MFKNELKFILDFNLNKLQELGPKFSLKDLKNSKVHPSLIKYIEAHIDLEILSDKLKLQQNSNFDYSGERISNYFGLIGKEIKGVKRFDQSYYSTLLKKAIIFNANFLTRPNQTLLQLIFVGKPKRTIEEIKAFISHAYYYRYLQKILFTYFEKKNVLSMTREEFANLLTKVDLISKDTHLYDTLDTAVNSMANFFDANINSSKVPLPAIKLYLTEKGLHEFLNQINQKFGFDNDSLQNSSDIQKLLKEVTPEEEITIETFGEPVDEFIEVENETDEFTHDIEVIEDNFEELKEDTLEDQKKKHDVEIRENLKNLLNDFDSAENKNPSQTLPNETPNQNIEKPDVKSLAKDLINLETIYKSLIKEPNPDEETKFIDSIKDKILNTELKETKFQIDLTTLSDSLNLKEAETIEEPYDEQLEAIEQNVDLKDDIVDNNDSSLKDSIDEIVNDEKTEKEFDEFIKNTKVEEEQETSSKNFDLDEDKLRMLEEDDEITEVFTDLSFLDKEEKKEELKIDIDTIEPVFEVDKEHEKYIPEGEIENLKLEETYESFSDILIQHDMTQIIEAIFDYDMEDYRIFIDKINNVSTENEAKQVLKTYLSQNHIDKDQKEVVELNELVSNYFSKSLT